MRNKISVCMIVKNESAHLARGLESVKEIAHEIIIVDTGSSDNTKEIASRYTSKVYDFLWCDDFSKARNYSLEQANNDYILVLDGDEYLTSFEKEFLDECNLEEDKVGRIILQNIYTRNGTVYRSSQRLARFFNKKNYYYKGKVHEQIVRKDNNEIKYYDIPFIVEHLGYEGDLEQRKKKTKRNLTYLFQALEENPKEPYILYQIAKSYHMEEDFEQTINYFNQLFSYDLDSRLEYVQDGVESFGYALLELERYEEALDLQGVYEEFSSSSDFLFLMGLIFMNNGYFLEAIQEFTKAISLSNGKVEGVDSFQAYYNIGVIYECLGEKIEAITYYKKCGDYENAINRITTI